MTTDTTDTSASASSDGTSSGKPASGGAAPGTQGPTSGDAGARESSPHYGPVRAMFEKSRADMLSPDHMVAVAARRQFNESRDWLYGTGALPRGIEAAPAPTPAELSAPFDGMADQIEKLYEPAAHPSEYRQRGTLAGEVEPGMIDGAREILFDLKLPADAGTAILDRVLHHRATLAEDGGTGTTFVEAGEAQEYYAEADTMLQSAGGFDAVSSLARAYVESVLPADKLAEFDAMLQKGGKFSTLAFDPIVLGRLAAMARARGLSPKKW